MTAPSGPDPQGTGLPAKPSKETLLLQRSGSFSALLFSSLGAFLYPALPASVRSTLPLPTFTLLTGGAGILLHRMVAKLWDTCLGDIASEGAEALKTFIRLKKIQYYTRIGVLAPEDGRRLMQEVVEADVRRALPGARRRIRSGR
jgi:hypothetical protein